MILRCEMAVMFDYLSDLHAKNIFFIFVNTFQKMTVWQQMITDGSIL